MPCDDPSKYLPTGNVSIMYLSASGGFRGRRGGSLPISKQWVVATGTAYATVCPPAVQSASPLKNPGSAIANAVSKLID